MDIVIYFLQLPYTILFYQFNILGYSVSFGSVIIWVALISWLWNMFYKLFD